MLSVRISTCCCSSCGWKSFRAKKTASSSRRFMCHRLWDSSYSPEAGIPSHTTPQPWVDASVVIITRDTTEHRGTPRLKRSGLRQSFDVAAIRKHPEVHAVHGTRDSSHSGHMCNNPGCNTAESATLSPSSLWNIFNWTELPCLKKAQGRQLAVARSRERRDFISTRSHERQALIPTRSHERQGLIPHAISREAGARMLSACWDIAVGTPSE